MDFTCDLDEYQILDLNRDVRAKLMKAGYEPPEFFGFMFAAPGASKRKLPLLCDKNWLHLVSLWNYAKGEIPMYMLATTAPLDTN